MASLVYGPTGRTFDLDDRTLAHLQYIVVQRFRRQESLLLTLTTERDGARERRTVWLTPSSPVEFVFGTDETHALDRSWLEELMQQAYSPHGIELEAGSDDREHGTRA